jgi:cytosine/adenosine deaminase-related metal-dependent hydrolase
MSAAEQAGLPRRTAFRAGAAVGGAAALAPVVAHVGIDVDRALRTLPERPRTINLHGHTAIPGIIDNHRHIVPMGNRPGLHTPLENAYSVDDMQWTCGDRAQHVAPGRAITTIGGFHFSQFSEGRVADARGAGRGRAEPSGIHLGQLQRTVGRGNVVHESGRLG